VYYMQEGKDITIACMMKQKEKVIKWMYNSKDIFVFQKSGPPRQGDKNAKKSKIRLAYLKIKNLQRLDTGKYECHSSGGKTEHQLYVVTVSTSPAGPLLHSSKATLNCGVEGRSPTKRIWKRPNGINVDTENGIASLSYVTLNDSGTWLCLIEDNGKEYKQELKINVLGADLLLLSEPLSENQSTTTPVLEQNLWLWIAVGVGCAILISLIIVAVLLHQRKKRIKRRMRKMKSLEQRMVARDYCVCNR
uniref:Uncharacterized LOC108922092 n=1 Tax=Scleropages formosus TaxID=113540 RepID=A0A8C9RXD1_SCLFO